MGNLQQALNLIVEEYRKLTDENDPYHGGVVNKKTKRKYNRIIDTLKTMVPPTSQKGTEKE